VVHVPKRKQQQRPPGRLTVHEIVILLAAISGLIWALHGNGPV
jgi:hypothetical protein